MMNEHGKKDKKLRFTALLHHIYNLETLRSAYLRLKREAAPGVDGETWQSYGEALEANLQDLSGRLKRGAYRAKPVRRVFIPKADGRQRPLGVTTLEDKMVQRAAVEVLNTEAPANRYAAPSHCLFSGKPRKHARLLLKALYSRRSPKEAMPEVWVAFQEHVGEAHPLEADD
jgi:retron-type reverse transcriptase